MLEKDEEYMLAKRFAEHEDPAKSGLRVLELPKHNGKEAWRDEPP